jgi:3-deoxy-D-manno-octulosonic-acid transferase
MEPPPIWHQIRRAVTCRVHPAELAYETAMRVAPAALRLAAPFSEKLRRGLDGRRASLASLHAWTSTGRDRGRPLLWLHAPSVGEALMAQAILAAARQQEPSIQSIFTFFSPSAERVAPRVGADWAGYLPWDRGFSMRDALALAAPACVAFVRTEIWPVLVRLARERGAGVVMLNAVLAEGSSRTGRAARTFLGPAYRRLDAVGAVSGDDAARFPLLGVPPQRIRVTGDARFDQVWQRVHALDRDSPLLRALRSDADVRGTGVLTVVAGSTWPADEERLLPALAALRTDGVRCRCIIAPHEPSAAHVAALEQRLDEHGFTHGRLPHDAPIPAVDALVVDRVGILADLYAIADLAYVGGGFGTAGLHSVVEPAALGVPVLYGPAHGNAQEASRLARAGGGFIASDGSLLLLELRRLCMDGKARAAAAAAAGDFVAAHIGGARNNAELALEHLRR